MKYTHMKQEAESKKLYVLDRPLIIIADILLLRTYLRMELLMYSLSVFSVKEEK